MNKYYLFFIVILIMSFFLKYNNRPMLQHYSKATILQTSRAGDNLKDKGTFNLAEPGRSHLYPYPPPYE